MKLLLYQDERSDRHYNQGGWLAPRTVLLASVRQLPEAIRKVKQNVGDYWIMREDNASLMEKLEQVSRYFIA